MLLWKHTFININKYTRIGIIPDHLGQTDPILDDEKRSKVKDTMSKVQEVAKVIFYRIHDSQNKISNIMY